MIPNFDHVVQAAQIFDVDGQLSASPPMDCRVAGAPVDCRVMRLVRAGGVPASPARY
jgi:hypothetical protein